MLGVEDPAATTCPQNGCSTFYIPGGCIRQPWPLPKSCQSTSIFWWRSLSCNLTGGEGLPCRAPLVTSLPFPQMPHARGTGTHPPSTCPDYPGCPLAIMQGREGTMETTEDNKSQEHNYISIKLPLIYT